MLISHRCGKTNVAMRFVKHSFEELDKPTIGVDFMTRDIQRSPTNSIKLKVIQYQ
jgi:GTPase SAR1 family protein